MPVEFALWGLVLIGVAICVIKVARLHVGEGHFFLGGAVVLFVAVLVMNVFMFTHADRSSDRETVLIVQAFAAAFGWIALLGSLSGMRRQSDVGS